MVFSELRYKKRTENGKIMKNLNKEQIKISTHLPFSVSFYWDWDNKGYGELTIDSLYQGKEIEIWNGNLEPEEVRMILHKFIDHVVDRAEFRERR
mgnify:CR=1 FL=1